MSSYHSIRDIDAGIGDLVCKIDVPGDRSRDFNHPVIALGNFQAVASYNWIQALRATILVPGSPSVWLNRQLPVTIRRDTEKQYVDQNAHRVPSSPLSPLIAAVLHMEPEFDFKKLDLVTDRNNLRKLLRWASRVSDKDVRIDVDRVGHTILFTRWEPKATDGAGNGFGHNFEVGMTKVAESCKGHRVTGHHRIVSFDFEGLSMLVRFEVDACSADIGVALARASDSADLENLLTGLTLKKENPDHPESSIGGITVIRSGTLVPQSSIIELKTRSMQSSFDATDAYPQLFFSQTPTLILGRHIRGTFSSAKPLLLSQMVVEQRAAQGGLAKLVSALKKLSSTIAEAQGEKFTLRLIGGELKLYQRVEGEALPEVLQKVFL